MRQKLCRMLYVGCLASVLSLGLAVGASGEVPDLLPSDRPDRAEPIWRSAAALQGGRGVEWSLLSREEREKLESRIATAHARAEELRASSPTLSAPFEKPCAAYGPSLPGGKSFRSLEASADGAQAIYTGTVLSFKQGLFLDSPSTLYELEIDGVLRAPEGAAEVRRVLVYFPAARFALGDEMLCRPALRGPESPRLGGRMLVFAAKPAAGDGAVVIPTEGLFFDGDDGLLSVPRAWRNIEELRSWPISQIEDQVRELVGGGR